MTHESTGAGNTTQAVPATAGEAADAGDAVGRQLTGARGGAAPAILLLIMRGVPTSTRA
jgi:hypothetical protein